MLPSTRISLVLEGGRERGRERGGVREGGREIVFFVWKVCSTDRKLSPLL